MEFANSALAPQNLVSIDTVNPYPDPVSVDTNVAGVIPPTEDTADKRSTKTETGLGRLGFNKKDLYQQYLDGHEQEVRESAARSLDAERFQKQQDDLVALAKKQGSPLTREQLLAASQPIEPTDPSTVIEDNYGKKYINKIYDHAFNIQDTFMDTAMDQIPEIVGLTQDRAASAASTIQYAMTKAENAQDTIAHQGYIPWTADLLKSGIPVAGSVYQAMKLRGNFGVSWFSGGITANNLDNAARELLKDTNLKTFKEKFDSVYEPLLEDNPQLAALFAQSVVGQSADQRYAAGAIELLDVSAVPVSAIKTARLVNQVRIGFQDGLRASAARRPSAAGTAEAFGDLGEAATQRATETLRSGPDGIYRPAPNNVPTRPVDPSSPMAKGYESLPSGLRTDRADIVKDATENGSLSRELTVRLENDYLKSEQQIVDTITGTSKVQRTGLDWATPEQLRAIKNSVVRGQYPSVHNTILDIGDPVYNDLANTYMLPVRMGTYDAEQFVSAEQAAAHAKREGFVEATVEGQPGLRQYLPEAAVKRPWETTPRFGETRTEQGMIKYFNEDGVEVAMSTKPSVGSIPVELVQKEQPLTFKTAKGSTYTVNEDGTTVRDKAARPEHPGEEGIQPKSQKTYYVSEKNAIKLSEFQAQGGPKVSIKETKGGRIGVHYLEGKDKGKFERRTVSKFETQPKQGLMPVEVWNDGTKVHFGNKITEVNVGVKPGDIRFHPTLTTQEAVTKAEIAQQGLGFHIKTWVPLNENDSLVKNLIQNLEGSKSIATTPGLSRWVNSIAGYVRSSDNTLAPFEVHQRKTATYAISNYHKYLQDEIQQVEDIYRGVTRIDPKTGKERNTAVAVAESLGKRLTNKQVWNEFKRALSAGPLRDDPVTKERGYYFRTVSELNSFYLENFERMPSFAEVRGYQAFRRLYEADRIFRGLREYTNKQRLGAMQHQFEFVDGSEKKVSGFFEGVSLKEFPGKEWPIAHIGSDGSVKVFRGNAAGSNYKKYVEAIKTGKLQVVEVYNPERFDLDTVPKLRGQFIRYVISDKFERKNLDWQQINRRSGGHFDLDYDYYIKQPHVVQMGKDQLYLGDKTLMPVKGNAQGQLIIKHLNEAMKQMLLKNEPAAKQIIQDKLGIPWKDWIKEFSSTKDELTGVVKPPRLTLGENFHVVPKNGSIATMSNDFADRFHNFKDGTHSSSLARNYQVGYTQERDSHDLMTLGIEGTKNNPIFKYQPAEFVDPITTMNRALNRIVSTSFMDDMKIAGIQLWLNEGKDWLKLKPKEVESSPYYAYMTATDRNAFVKDAPDVVVRNLLSNRFKTKMFMGQPSWFDTTMHEASQLLADKMFDNLGPKGQLVPTWLLGKIDGPIAILRSLAYHVKLGVWSPHQIITQGQSFATILAVSPRSAVGATVANFLHEYAQWNRSPAMLNKLDEIAVHMGSIPGFHAWKIGEWKEAFLELNKRGFANVGEEYSMLDTQLGKSFIKGNVGNVLDSATMFFRGIESRVRRGAWYTSYLEAKRNNPSTIFSEADKSAVLDRADDLSGNMSRASASVLQSGPLSAIMQFSKYQIGLAEYFWSKRLGDTLGERSLARLRMALTYGMFFGAVGTVGLTGLPMGDYLRKVAINNGYVVGDNWLSSMVMEGPTSVALAWATGDGDISKGNMYNLNKLGAGGIKQISDLMDAFNGDKSWWEMTPSTSIGYNTFVKNTSGIRRDIASMFSEKTEDHVFEPKWNDFADIFKEVSSMDSATRYAAALGTGKWMSKNEAYQTDVSGATALTMALTGLTLSKVDDDFLLDGIVKSDKKNFDYAISKFKLEGQRAIDALDNHDPEQYKSFMGRAFAWLFAFDVPVGKYPEAASSLLRGNEAKVETSRYNWAFGKNVPESQKETRQDAYTRFRKQQQ